MSHRASLSLLIICLFLFSCGGGGGGGTSPVAPPSAPAGVVAIAGNTQVMLSWEEVSGATGYNIYFSTTAGAVQTTGTKISGVTRPYYLDGLSNGTVYYCVVTATNQYGESVASPEVSAAPSQTIPPLPPKDVKALGTNRQVILRWTAVGFFNDSISHNIYWSILPGVKKGNGIKIPDVVSPYSHDDLTNGTTYYYVVTSLNAYGESVESQEVSISPGQGHTPSAPTGVRVVAGDREAVIIWDDSGEAGHYATYNLYWSLSDNVSKGNGTKIAGVQSPYRHGGLAQGSTYYYVVTTENGYGESDDSARISVAIPGTRQDICVALGDSITDGTGVSSYSNCYVPLLASRWGKVVVNKAAGGALASYGAAIVDAVLNEYNPRYLTIYLGTNDAGFIYPDVILSNLQYIVERAKANGTIPVIATLGPSIYDWAWKTSDTLEVNRRIRQLAASQGIACADIDVALGWNHSYMADGLHPNDAGHQIIADTFYNALTR